VLDPEKEFFKIADSSKFVGFDLEFDGQIHYKKNEFFFNNYKLVICVNIGNPINLFILLKCKHSTCNTVVLSDGIYEWDNSHKNPKTLVNNVVLFDSLFVDYIYLVGLNNRYLEHSNPWSVFKIHTPVRMKKMKVNDSDSLKVNRLLITTAKTAFFDNKERGRLISLINNVHKESLKVFDEIEFRIFDHDLFNDLENTQSSINNLDKKFGEIVVNYSAIVTTPSSISLEIISNKIPLGHLDVRDSPLFLQSGWRITGSSDINETLNSMLSKDQKRMSFQESQIESEDKIFDPVQINLDNKSLFVMSLHQEIDSLADKILTSKWNFNIKVMVKKIIIILKLR